MKKEKIYKILEEIAPLELADTWDNSGIQIDNYNNEVSKVMVALDITKEVVLSAIESEVQLIVTHHPTLITPINCISVENATHRNIIELVNNNISVYSAHTNFDKVKGGNNDYMLDLLQLEEGTTFGEYCRKGKVSEEMSVLEFRKHVSNKLECKEESIKIIGNKEMKLNTIGLCTGAGSSFIEQAQKENCDIFLTGDIKYHAAIDVIENNYTVLDCGHFETERIFIENMSNKLKEKLKGVEIVRCNVEQSPFE